MYHHCRLSKLTASRRAVLFATTVFTGLLSVAVGQDKTPNENQKPDDIYVLSPFSVSQQNDKGYITENTLSGLGISTPIAKLPQTIQVANKELLGDLGAGAGDMLSSLQMISGGIQKRSDNNGDDQFVWGFRLNFSLRDGVPVGFSNPIGVLYDIDRVEVIKGPAAALFGQASFVGGLINYIPRSTSLTPKYEARVTFGSFNLKAAEVHASGPLTSKLRYRVDVGTTDRDGSRLFSYYEDKFVGAGLDYALGKNTELSLAGSYSKADRAATTTVAEQYLVDGKYIIPSVDLGNRTINTPFRDQDDYATVTTTFSAKLKTIFEGGVASQTAVNYNQNDENMQRTQGDGNVMYLGPPQRIGRISLGFTPIDHNWFIQQSFNKELQTGPIKHQFNLIGDARFRTHEDQTVYYGLDPRAPGPLSATRPDPSFNLANPDYTLRRFSPNNYGQPLALDNRTTTRLSGASLTDVASFWKDRVSLLYSIRFNDAFETSGVPIRSYSASTPVQTVSKGSTVMRRYGVTVAPIKDVLVYFNQGQAFIFNTGLDYLDRPLTPSIGTNKEVGVKAAFFNGALVATLSRFDIEVTNVRVVFTQGPNDPQPGLGGIRQDGSQVNTGYDLSLTGSKRFTAGLLNITGTVYQGDIKDERGLKPLHPSNNTYSVWGTFSIGTGLLKGVKFGLGENYTGERVGPNLNAIVGAVPSRIHSWTNVKAMVSYTWKNVTFQVNGDNLRNVENAIDGFESAAWLTTAPLRNYRFSASYSF